MGLPELKHMGYTPEDWKGWEGRWELIQGVAYDMTPAPSLGHQRVVTRMTARVFQALEEGNRASGRGDCEVFTAPVDLFLGEDVFQPDLVVVCDPEKKTDRGIEGAPDLVVEVLSPSTAAKDTVRKRWAYEAAGVPEYLIIDPGERIGLLLKLDDQKRYQDAARAEWGQVVALLDDRLRISLGE